MKALWIILLVAISNLLGFAKPFTTSINTSGNHDNEKIIHSAWYHWDPYQYQLKINETDSEILTGLDIELINALFRRLGKKVDYTPMKWAEHQRAVERGEKDFAAGAFSSIEREKYAYISDPYRTEENVLYVPRGKSADYNFVGTKDMLQFFKKNNFKLGIVKGYNYADKLLNQYILDPGNQDLLVPANNEVGNFENLHMGKINGFIIDRTVGATIAWRNHWKNAVEEHPGFYASDSIHILLSKKNFSPGFIQDINAEIKAMQQDGEYQRIVKNYILPVLLIMTIETNWFFLLEMLGIVAFAMSGVLIAFKEKYSLIGAFVLSSLPAVGGGIIRDVMVDRKLSIFKMPMYIATVIIVVLTSFIVVKLFRLSKKTFPHAINTLSRLLSQSFYQRYFAKFEWLMIFDAIGLSAFTVLGVVIAVESKLEPLLLWGPLIAMITSFAGGIVRDVLRQKGTKIDTLSGAFYGEVSLLWGIIFCLFIEWQLLRLNLNEILIGVVVTVIGAFITRLIAVKLNIRSFIC